MTLFIREKLQEVFMQTGTTMLLVSHDLEEAVYLADQVLLLTKRPGDVVPGDLGVKDLARVRAELNISNEGDPQ